MSLLTALFLIVVLAMLALFAVRVGASGEQDLTASIQQERALAAARSGIEYGAHFALAGSCGASGVVRNFALTLTQGALNGFRVAVRCQGWQHIHNPGGFYWTYDLDVTAQKGTYGTAGYVMRRLTKTVSNGRPPP
jgi:hypothetical protein